MHNSLMKTLVIVYRGLQRRIYAFLHHHHHQRTFVHFMRHVARQSKSSGILRASSKLVVLINRPIAKCVNVHNIQFSLRYDMVSRRARSGGR